MDGSVHFIKNSVNFATWYALATPAGGEVDQQRLVLKNQSRGVTTPNSQIHDRRRRHLLELV